MAVEIDIKYEGDLQCLAVHGPSNVSLATDAPTDNGGKGQAFSPTDLVATALGTCMATIMGLVAKRTNVDIAGTQIRVAKEMTREGVRRISQLQVRIVMPKDKTYTPADRTRFQQAADGCPVKQSLHPDVAIVTEFVYAD